MSDELANGIYITESREDVEKLKERWEKVKRISEKVADIAGSGFLVSLLSPFDFEGPIIEIISGVTWCIAKVVERGADKKLSLYKNKAHAS